jgi:NADH-quinone oxidoreductase subunit A
MIFAALVGAGLLTLSALLGRQVGTRRKLSTYECGMPLLDGSRKRISVKYSVVAMVFILFDVEIAFLYPWTVIFRSSGWGMFAEMIVFLATLAVGYAYIWKKGALDW